MSAISLFLIIVAIPIAVSKYDPSPDFCGKVEKICSQMPIKKHLSCGGKLPEMISGEKTRFYMTDELKTLIIDLHNERRNAIACGNPKLVNLAGQRFPKAAEMGKLVWDDELEWGSQLNAFTCSNSHDCPVTQSYLTAGQNVEMMRSEQVLTAKQFIKKAVSKWFLEYVNTPIAVIDSYRSGVAKEQDAITEDDMNILKDFISSKSQMQSTVSFTSLVTDLDPENKVARIGCAAYDCDSDSDDLLSYYLVCNYARGNALNEPVYKRTKSEGGSECKTKSKLFCCLCLDEKDETENADSNCQNATFDWPRLEEIITTTEASSTTESSSTIESSSTALSVSTIEDSSTTLDLSTIEVSSSTESSSTDKSDSTTPDNILTTEGSSSTEGSYTIAIESSSTTSTTLTTDSTTERFSTIGSSSTTGSYSTTEGSSSTVGSSTTAIESTSINSTTDSTTERFSTIGTTGGYSTTEGSSSTVGSSTTAIESTSTTEGSMSTESDSTAERFSTIGSSSSTGGYSATEGSSSTDGFSITEGTSTNLVDTSTTTEVSDSTTESYSMNVSSSTIVNESTLTTESSSTIRGPLTTGVDLAIKDSSTTWSSSTISGPLKTEGSSTTHDSSKSNIDSKVINSSAEDRSKNGCASEGSLTTEVSSTQSLEIEKTTKRHWCHDYFSNGANTRPLLFVICIALAFLFIFYLAK